MEDSSLQRVTFGMTGWYYSVYRRFLTPPHYFKDEGLVMLSLWKIPLSTALLYGRRAGYAALMEDSSLQRVTFGLMGWYCSGYGRFLTPMRYFRDDGMVLLSLWKIPLSTALLYGRRAGYAALMEDSSLHLATSGMTGWYCSDYGRFLTPPRSVRNDVLA